MTKSQIILSRFTATPSRMGLAVTVDARVETPEGATEWRFSSQLRKGWDVSPDASMYRNGGALRTPLAPYQVTHYLDAGSKHDDYSRVRRFVTRVFERVRDAWAEASAQERASILVGLWHHAIKLREADIEGLWQRAIEFETDPCRRDDALALRDRLGREEPQRGFDLLQTLGLWSPYADVQPSPHSALEALFGDNLDVLVDAPAPRD